MRHPAPPGALFCQSTTQTKEARMDLLMILALIGIGLFHVCRKEPDDDRN